MPVVTTDRGITLAAYLRNCDFPVGRQPEVHGDEPRTSAGISHQQHVRLAARLRARRIDSLDAANLQARLDYRACNAVPYQHKHHRELDHIEPINLQGVWRVMTVYARSQTRGQKAERISFRPAMGWSAYLSQCSSNSRRSSSAAIIAHMAYVHDSIPVTAVPCRCSLLMRM